MNFEVPKSVWIVGGIGIVLVLLNLNRKKEIQIGVTNELIDGKTGKYKDFERIHNATTEVRDITQGVVYGTINR